MLSTHLGASADLPPWAVIAACVLAAASLFLLLVEVRRHAQERLAVVASGLLAVAALLGAVLRPARVSARENPVGARVVVLADASRSMALAGDDGRPRSAVRDEAIARLARSGQNARFVVLGFGDGPPSPLPDASKGDDASAREPRSDLAAAMRALAASPGGAPGGGRRGQRRAARQPAGRGVGGDAARPRRRARASRSTPSRPRASSPQTRASGESAPPARPWLTCRCRCAWRSAVPAASRATSSPSRRASCATTALRPLLASGVVHLEDGKGTHRSHDHPRASRDAHRRGGTRASRRRRDPGERPATRHVQRLARARSRAPRRGASRPTTCARCGNGSRATPPSTSLRSSSCAPRRATYAPGTTTWRSSRSRSTSCSRTTCPASTPSSCKTSTRNPMASRSTSTTSATTCAAAVAS